MSDEPSFLSATRDRDIVRRVHELGANARRWWRYPAYLGGVSAFGLGVDALLGVPAALTGWTLGALALTFLFPLRRDLKLAARVARLGSADDYFRFYRDHLQEQITLLKRQRALMFGLSAYIALAMIVVLVETAPLLPLVTVLALALPVAAPAYIGARRSSRSLARQRAHLEALAAG